MINVEIGSLNQTQEAIRDLLGPDLHDTLESYGDEQINDSDLHQRARAPHPLAPMWVNLKRDFEKSEEIGYLKFGKDAIALLNIYSNLSDIKHLENFGRILEHIHDSQMFYSAAFEAEVAAGYVAKGYDVRIVPEEGDEKAPDFVVYSEGGGTVGVECKSLLNDSVEEQPLWDDLIQEIVKLSEQYERSWQISIWARENIKGSDTYDMGNIIKGKFKRGDPSSVDREKWLIDFDVIADYGEELKGELRTPQRADIMDVRFTARPSGSAVYIRNATIVNIRQFFSATHRGSRIVKQLKKARPQLYQGRPNVVHVEIPYWESGKIMDVVDTHYEAVAEELKRRYSRISTVVLSASSFPLTDAHTEPLRRVSIVVPNPRAKTSLPRSFSPIGIIEDEEAVASLKQGPCGGVIILHFTVHDQVTSEAGRDLVWKSSYDGSCQLRLWQTLTNRFRVEAITPDLGRVYDDFDVSDLAVDVEHKLAARISEDGIRLTLDGELIEPVGTER